MSVVVAVVLALGVFLVYDGTTRAKGPAGRPRGHGVRWRRSLGLADARPVQLAAVCAGVGLAAGAVVVLVIGSAAVAAIAVIAGAVAPIASLRSRARSLRARQRRAWPDAVELLAGCIRVGETLPGSIAVVADRGPEPLRDLFRAVVTDHRVSGDLVGALERMQRRAGDPVADRVVHTLTLAHRVGGREVGRLLRTLADLLREDAANRREIEARQSWTVVAARVSACAPWLVLALVASRPGGAQAFDSAGGVVVLVGGAVATIVGYRTMLRIARLPDEPRVAGGSR